MRILTTLLLWLALALPAFAQQTLLPNGKQSFFDANGNPLNGGTVQFYLPGTTTPKGTFKDSAGSVPNTNPVVLDAAGRAVIFGNGAYRQVVKDFLGNVIWDQTTYGEDPGNYLWGGTSTGSGNTPSVSVPGFTAGNGQTITYVANAANTGSVALTVNGTSYPVVKNTATGPVALLGGEIAVGNTVVMVYNATSGQFNFVSQYPLTNTALTNTEKQITAAYTAVSADANKTLVATGAFYQITFNTAGLFPATFQVAIHNANSSNGKRITLVGGQSFILWPKQTVTIRNNPSAGGWTCEPQCGWRYAQASVNYFVSNSGDDTNDCLSASFPCLTIGRAVQRVYQDLDSKQGPPTINVACGTYPESVDIQGPSGYGSITTWIVGATPGCVIWRNATAAGSFSVQVGDLATVIFKNITWDCSGCTGTNFGLAMHQSAIVDLFDGITFGTMTNGYHIYSDGMNKINMPSFYQIQGSAQYHMYMGPLSYVIWTNPASAISITTTPTFAVMFQLQGGAQMQMAGLNMAVSGSPIAAGTRYAVSGNAYLNQAGVIWPTGSTAGVPTPGSTPWGGQVQ